MENGMIHGDCQIQSNSLFNGIIYNSDELKITTSTSGSSTSSSSSSFSSSSSPSNNFNYISHDICKMDTLAGIAIKYGVEISDVRRINGLVTDLQMFSHKTLRIPFQGRHPTCHQEIAYDATKNAEHHREIISGFGTHNLKAPRHSKECPATWPLHEHYGLPPTGKRKDAQHKTSRSLCLRNEDLLLINKPVPKQHRRSRSLQTGDATEGNSDSMRTGKQCQGANSDPEGSSETGTAPMMASLFVNKLLTIRKSSSTSSLQDFDIASSYSMFVATSKWNLLPATFTMPNFDGFRNPIASWRNKSAQD